MPMRRVFLSFASEDLPTVKGLQLLAANPGYELDFYNESLRVAINSTNATYIKSVLREKIRRASVTVCVIGTETHKSEWVDWELAESLAHGNALVAMAVKGVDRAVLPTAIKAAGVPFHPWDTGQLGTWIAQA